MTDHYAHGDPEAMRAVMESIGRELSGKGGTPQELVQYEEILATQPRPAIRKQPKG